jgi:hypothetical protein
LTEAWFFALCVLLAAVEVARPLTLIVYGAFLMVRSIRGLARLPHESFPRRATGRRFVR